MHRDPKIALASASKLFYFVIDTIQMEESIEQEEN